MTEEEWVSNKIEKIYNDAMVFGKGLCIEDISVEQVSKLSQYMIACLPQCEKLKDSVKSNIGVLLTTYVKDCMTSVHTEEFPHLIKFLNRLNNTEIKYILAIFANFIRRHYTTNNITISWINLYPSLLGHIYE